MKTKKKEDSKNIDDIEIKKLTKEIEQEKSMIEITECTIRRTQKARYTEAQELLLAGLKESVAIGKAYILVMEKQIIGKINYLKIIEKRIKHHQKFTMLVQKLGKKRMTIDELAINESIEESLRLIEKEGIETVFKKLLRENTYSSLVRKYGLSSHTIGRYKKGQKLKESTMRSCIIKVKKQQI